MVKWRFSKRQVLPLAIATLTGASTLHKSRAGSIPEFIRYLTIPELCSILDTRYLRLKSRLYKLKLQIICGKKY